MINNFKLTIGLEVHVVVNTKAKMFSNAKNSHHSIENTNVSFMDLALPGIMPIVNKKVIEKAIILANALHMDVNYRNIQFDRKNYFYIDLPKGFQITQQYFPIGKNGYIEINEPNNNLKKIMIERIHMEEDTAKQIINNNERILNYNRAGSPLIEIVTTPCLTSAYDATEFLKQLRRILVFKDISDAKMEDGSMRVDINISVAPIGSPELGTRVEIKNVNSILNVAKAIEFESKRQIMMLLKNEVIHQETRRYNDLLATTEFLRQKTDAIDYHYMTEPNIVHFYLTKNEYEQVILSAKKDIDLIIQDLKNTSLEDKQINFLLDNYEYYCLFLQLYQKINNEKLVFNWINTELIGYLNKNNLTYNDLKPSFINEFNNLLFLLNKQEINSKQAKILFEHLQLDSNKTIDNLIKELKFEQINDPQIILTIIKKYIQNNSDLINQYPQRPERVEKFLAGMVMKETNSQANPKVVDELIKNELSTMFK